MLVTTRPCTGAKWRPCARACQLAHVILIDGDGTLPDTLPGRRLMEQASADFTIPPTSPDDIALLHFTSGTTGRPKGALHVHEAVVAHQATGLYALDLHADDIFWCTADPGWVTGTELWRHRAAAHGVTSIVDEAEFDAGRWYALLARERVTVWYTAPTAIRMMMKLGAEAVRGLRSIRRCASWPASASRSIRKRWSGAPRRSACPSMTTGGRPRPAES